MFTIQDQAKALSRGSEWREVRNNHIEEQPWCQCCGRHTQLEVHHYIPWHLAIDLRTDPRNLVTLCRECHFRYGHFSHWKDYNPDLKEHIEYMRKHVAIPARLARGWDV